MDLFRKNQILLSCNTIPVLDLIEIIKSGDILLPEFVTAGLDSDKMKSIEDAMREAEIQKGVKEKIDQDDKKKAEIINNILKKRIGADRIKQLVNSRTISFDDLLDAGLSNTMLNSLKHFCSTDRIRRPRTIDELPPMQEGRTDVYFIGVAGSGKSTMLAGLLKTAHMLGISLPDPSSNNDGAIYQTELIQDLNKGVLPQGTQQGTYNYVALSLRDQNEKKHPFNIVDVPGENYKNIFQNAEVETLLRYIRNSNKKILIFVIDSLAHDNEYNNSANQLDQSIAYVNILQIFASNGILEQTDAIYLIANKFDAIKEKRYPHDDRKKGDLALEYLSEEFLSLIENCKSVRKDSRNKFKIKIIPFSIGSISHDYILNTFNKEFSNTLLNQLLKDSFIIKGGGPVIFK